MIMMSVYSGIGVHECKKESYKMSKGNLYMFQYKESFACHYLYIGTVNNHNYVHPDGEKNHQVGLENVWIIKS